MPNRRTQIEALSALIRSATDALEYLTHTHATLPQSDLDRCALHLRRAGLEKLPEWLP